MDSQKVSGGPRCPAGWVGGARGTRRRRARPGLGPGTHPSRPDLTREPTGCRGLARDPGRPLSSTWLRAGTAGRNPRAAPGSPPLSADARPFSSRSPQRAPRVGPSSAGVPWLCLAWGPPRRRQSGVLLLLFSRVPALLGPGTESPLYRCPLPFSWLIYKQISVFA